MKMKRYYIRPEVEALHVDVEPLLTNSVTSIDGLDGVEPGEGDFPGGDADSRLFEFLF